MASWLLVIGAALLVLAFWGEWLWLRLWRWRWKVGTVVHQRFFRYRPVGRNHSSPLFDGARLQWEAADRRMAQAKKAAAKEAAANRKRKAKRKAQRKPAEPRAPATPARARWHGANIAPAEEARHIHPADYVVAIDPLPEDGEAWDDVSDDGVVRYHAPRHTVSYQHGGHLNEPYVRACRDGDRAPEELHGPVVSRTASNE